MKYEFPTFTQADIDEFKTFASGILLNTVKHCHDDHPNNDLLEAAFGDDEMAWYSFIVWFFTNNKEALIEAAR